MEQRMPAAETLLVWIPGAGELSHVPHHPGGSATNDVGNAPRQVQDLFVHPAGNVGHLVQRSDVPGSGRRAGVAECELMQSLIEEQVLHERTDLVPDGS